MAAKKPLDIQKVDQLKLQIKGFIDYSWHLHVRNDRLNTTLIVAGLALVATVTIVGYLGYGIAAGIIGTVATLFIGFQNAFNFGEKADYCKIVHTEAKALRDHLNYKVSSVKDFEAVVDTLAVLRNQLALNLPKGKGMEEVKRLSSTFLLENQRTREG